MGLNAVGLGIATLFAKRGVKQRIVVGHDFRSYSASVKQALMTGLLAGGMEVHDIGLALSPVAYFAQFDLDVRRRRDGDGEPQRQRLDRHQDGAGAAADVRAGGNVGAEGDGAIRPLRGGAGRPLHFRRGHGRALPQGAHRPAQAQAPPKGRDRDRQRHRRRLRAARLRSPRLRGRAAAHHPRLHLPQLQSQPRGPGHAARRCGQGAGDKADLGLAFDGDGDRCGVVDNEGSEIFADKVGVMLARDISGLHANAKFVADVKSTGLFLTDPVLKANGATTTYWKTGHSYIKRYSHETKALVGFEKSGHFFFNPPLGRGYDDGIVAGLAVCDMLDRNPDKSMADLKNALPKTWQSPTMSPHCGDEVKYGVVERVLAHYQALTDKGGTVAGQKIRELITVNGVRVVLEDGTWGLVRASSNKPELVVVVESPASEANMKAIFADIDRELGKYPEVGEYNQKIVA